MVSWAATGSSAWLQLPFALRAATAVRRRTYLPWPLMPAYAPVPWLSLYLPCSRTLSGQVLRSTACLPWPREWLMRKVPPGNFTRSLVLPAMSVPPAVNFPVAMIVLGLDVAAVLISRKCSVLAVRWLAAVWLAAWLAPAAGRPETAMVLAVATTPAGPR